MEWLYIPAYQTLVIYLFIYYLWEDGKPMLYSNIYIMHYIKNLLNSFVEFVTF